MPARDVNGPGCLPCRPRLITYAPPGLLSLAGLAGMKVLIIGSGGREHALAWKLAGSTRVTDL
ncbi:MAG: hypothetical protein ABSB33_04865, partial [Tepidisphaeraceae bacterium]